MRPLLVCGAAGALSLAVSLAVAPAAGAAPDNKHVGSDVVTCDGNTVEVSFVEHDQSARGFVNGEVIVAKEFTGDITLTLAIDGTVVATFPEGFADQRGAQGHGHDGKLIECTGIESFSDSFVIDEAGAAELAVEFPSIDWASYIGSTVTFSGSGTFTAKVMLPGR